VEREQWIFRFTEITQYDNMKVGRKCANLGEMTRNGLPVPPGFALSVDAYLMFLERTNLSKKIQEYLKGWDFSTKLAYTQYQEISTNLRRMIVAEAMPEDLADTIRQYYREIEAKSQVKDVAVAVRSSGPISMPGQFETYLNVRGEENVIRQIIRCWSSTFTTQAIAYRIQRGSQDPAFFRPYLGMSESLELDILSPIGVAVLKMANARSSGVAFTIHPTTGDRGKVVVEGSWGLGESVVGGDISPDRFVVDKKTFQVEPTINCKTKQVIYSSEGTCEADVPPELQSSPCLTGEELERIVRCALELEKYFGTAQDVEWAIDKDLPPGENLMILQTRQVSKIVEHKKEVSTESIVDMLIRNVFNRGTS